MAPSGPTRAGLAARLNVARAAALQRARHGGAITHVQTAADGPRPCAECQHLTARVYTLAEALAKPPLPCAGCTTALHAGWAPVCRCTYRFHEGDPRG